MRATSLSDQLALRRLDSATTNKPEIDYFVSTHHPAGNAASIAYGGSTIGVAIHAACQSVWSNATSPSSDFKLYSVAGYFLGPAKIDRPLACEVSRVRESRTFKTRRVMVMQTYDDGSVRECLTLTADFMKVENDVEMSYSAPPVVNTSDTSTNLFKSGPHGPNTVSWNDLGPELLSVGKASKQEVTAFHRMFSLLDTYQETRLCRAGVGGQNLNGLAKSVHTTQDVVGLGITQKTTLEWMRALHPLVSQGENMAALGFNMDGGLSFLPLIHGGEGKFLDDVGACSSLDFSMRIFQSGEEKMEMDKWKLKERRTIAAAGGRTYSEGRLWDERGMIVASMTQVCILRPKAQAQMKTAGKL